ncbi:M28 family metallopeptidase [Miltoncostaea marina]|uniref:M28 family metallopeptidase n=1 Tax=Miltoncostaea marina TaxID=2843215 RepID=UPI001C3E5964|nr:M28 family metallopeptidase [Miltoncostaea marina]
MPRARRLIAALLVAAAAALAGACGDGGASAAATAGPAATDRFDAGRAWADLRRQVAMGPRPAGSPASRRLAAYLRARLPRGRFEAVPGGLRNVVGALPGRGRPILVGAHYDTKDLPGFVGANDGAGGVAVVLEVARALRTGQRACQRPIRFVMFDGEESSRGSTDFLRDGMRGSRFHAATARPLPLVAVIVDFVADRDLSIPREATSDPRVWARLRRAAAAVGAARVFQGGTGAAVYDDHTPFLEAGVPAIDLIDFDYPHFHRRSDDLRAVSPRSLDAVGETLVELLRRMRADGCRAR